MAAGAANQQKQQSPVDNGQIPSAAAWIKMAVHKITCPTGMVVRIKIPDLSALMVGGAVPENLRGAALFHLAGGLAELERDENGIPRGLNDEMLQGVTDLRFWTIHQAIVEPKLTEEQVRSLPVEDRELILAIAERQTAYDALGVKIGVSPLALFEPFSRVHGCEADCEACQALRRRVSAGGLDVV
jgi:hypothetical protein